MGMDEGEPQGCCLAKKAVAFFKISRSSNSRLFSSRRRRTSPRKPPSLAAGLPDVIAHGMLTMGLGAGFASAWSGDPGAVTRYAVRLSAPAIVSATDSADIEFGGRIKSLDPATRSGVAIVTAKSAGRKIFGLATLDVRFR